MTWQEYLAGVDDSHPMTTAREHITDICRLAERCGGEVLELGSHAGISTAAIALATPGSVVSVDLCDTVPEAARTDYWRSLGLTNITPVQADAGRFLRQCQLLLRSYALIFHDAAHGDAVLPEYLTAAGLTDCLVIHDWEQLSEENRATVAGRFDTVTTSADEHGRTLFVGLR